MLWEQCCWREMQMQPKGKTFSVAVAPIAKDCRAERQGHYLCWQGTWELAIRQKLVLCGWFEMARSVKPLVTSISRNAPARISHMIGMKYLVLLSRHAT